MIRTISLVSEFSRRKVIEFVTDAPLGTIVTIGEAPATSPQNDKVHPVVREIKVYLESKGAPKRSEDWWRYYLVAKYAGHEIVPDPDGSGRFTVMNKISGTTEMTKAVKSEFIEWLYAFGSEIGMEWD